MSAVKPVKALRQTGVITESNLSVSRSPYMQRSAWLCYHYVAVL